MIRALCLASLLSLATAAAAQADENYLGETLDGATVSLDDHRGHPTVVAFWASWCAPCLDEVPRLQAMQREIGAERLGLVFVSYRDDPARSDALTRRWAAGGGQFVRARRHTPGYLNAVESLPTTWLFDASGEVSGIYKGADERVMTRLRARIDSLLAGR